MLTPHSGAIDGRPNPAGTYFKSATIARQALWPCPVVEVRYADSPVLRRYSFWCPKDRPQLAEDLGRKTAEAFTSLHGRVMSFKVEGLPASSGQRAPRVNFKAMAQAMADALRRLDPDAPELKAWAEAA